MSVDEKGSDASPQQEPAPVPETPGLPVLRREAIMLHQERGRIATLVAVCSLLGVALGFSLSTMAAAMQAASGRPHQLQVRTVSLIQPGYEDAATPTWLGVTFTRARCGSGGGALVTKVHPGSPAAMVGVQSGDVIVAVNGSPVERSDDLISLIRAESPGTRATVHVRRDGALRSFDPRLDRMPAHLARTLR